MLLQLFPLLAVLSGQPVTLTADTFNLTGITNIKVSNVIQGSPGTVIRYDRIEPGDTGFVFKAVTGAVFKDITFVGPSGNTHINGPGSLGCVRVWSTAKFINCHFINFPKWSVDLRGDRKTLTDTTSFTNCIFEGSKMEGYGYGVWCQYATMVADNCLFTNCRHGIDGSSEGHRIILRNCKFDLCYISAIHEHEYQNGMSGAGFDILGCWFGNNSTNIDIRTPFPPGVNRIEGSMYWDGKGTSFWIKSHNAIVEVYNGTVKTETIGSDKWEFHNYRYKATIRIFGVGTVYVDDFIENFASRYYTFEDSSAPSIRYIISGAKVDKLKSESVSGDRSLRIRVDSQAIEVY